LLHIYNL